MTSSATQVEDMDERLRSPTAGYGGAAPVFAITAPSYCKRGRTARQFILTTDDYSIDHARTHLNTPVTHPINGGIATPCATCCFAPTACILISTGRRADQWLEDGEALPGAAGRGRGTKLHRHSSRLSAPLERDLLDANRGGQRITVMRRQVFKLLWDDLVSGTARSRRGSHGSAADHPQLDFRTYAATRSASSYADEIITFRPRAGRKFLHDDPANLLLGYLSA